MDMDSKPPVASTSAATMAISLNSASPSDGTSPLGSTSAPSKSKVGGKRPKTQTSCQECRRLKLKCDRVWPCLNCRKRGRAELCPHGVSKPPGRATRVNAELNALLRRVQELETALHDVGAADRIPPSLALEFAGRAHKHKQDPNEAEGDADDPMYEQDLDHSHISSPQDEASSVEAMLQGVGSLSIREEDGRVRYLGTSAGPAYYFQDEDEDSEDSDDQSPSSPSSQVVRYPFIQLASYYSRTAELERLRTFLPHPTETARLAKNYYQFLSFQFEPVEEDVFLDDYLPAAQAVGNSAGTKLAFVFIVLSLGALMDPRAPSTPNALAHHYFQLSQATLAASRFLSNNTLAGVQTLQLTASFLLNTHDLQEGGETFFPLLGMALRMLVAMGLHRDGSQWGMDGPELDRRRLTFYELITLERMQAFISGRPYMMAPGHFDTKFPSNAEPYHIEKWRTGNFIARVIDECFSTTSPPYSTITTLDHDLRKMFEDSPAELRSGALPEDAFVVRPAQPPALPEPPVTSASLKVRMRQHTLDMIFSQIFFYLHLPALRRALKMFPDEPLSSPWADSVAIVALETGVYMLAIARSWINLHPVLTPRWWHPTFHAFAAACAQSSIVIQSPKSILARHSWTQLMVAIDVFETAASGGAPVAMFVPRLHALRDAAFKSLQAANSVPVGLPSTQVTDYLAKGKGTDAELSILGTTTRLDRRPKKRPGAHETPSFAAAAAVSLAQPPPPPPATVAAAPLRTSTSNEELYTPFDSPVLVPATRASFPDLSFDALFNLQNDDSPTYQSATMPPITSTFAAPTLDFADHRRRSNAASSAAAAALPGPVPGLSMQQISDPPAALMINDALGSMGFTNFATGGFHPAPWAHATAFNAATPIIDETSGANAMFNGTANGEDAKWRLFDMYKHGGGASF